MSVVAITVHHDCDGCDFKGEVTREVPPDIAVMMAVNLPLIHLPMGWIRIDGEAQGTYCSRECFVRKMNEEIVMDQVEEIDKTTTKRSDDRPDE